MAKQLFKVVAEANADGRQLIFQIVDMEGSENYTQLAKDQLEVLWALFTHFENKLKKERKKKRRLIGYFLALFKYWKYFHCCRVYLFALLLSSSSYDGRHCGKRQMGIVHCGSVLVHMYYIFVCMYVRL